MPALRRLTSMLATAALGWTALTQVVAAPSAQADPPHDPATYYAGTEGLTGAALATKLNTIVSGHTRLSYDQLWDALPATDVDPHDGAAIIDVYSGTSLLASSKCNHSGSCAGEWNREHSWAKSHGDFGTVTGPGTDLFHMRPELADVNSSRGNLDFDDGGTASIANCALCKKDSDSFEPREAIKGDIARGLFYMAVAYDGGDGFPDLVLNDFTCNAGSKAPNHGKLSTLVAWSLADPPDDLERARNDLVDGTYQHNRNPFIDHPEWVTDIWGTGVGQGPACGTTGGGGGGGGTPPNVVISEAYVNGGSTGATYKNKYVELYNPLTSAVDLSQYSLQYRAAGSTGAATGIYNFAAGATVAANGFFVVKLPGNSTGAGAELPQVDGDGSSTGVNPGGGGGTLFLAGIHALVPPDDDSVGDILGWGNSNAPETSPASGNSVTKSLQRNGCNSDTDDNSTDFTALAPTPAAGSGTCTPANHAPTTAPMTATTAEDTATSLPLVADDQDGDTLTWSIGSAAAHGTASLTGSTLGYTPAGDFHGTDQVDLTVSDGHGGTATTTVTITITSVNDTPVAHDVGAGTTPNTSTQIALDASDVDDTDLTYAVATPPAHGAVTVDGSTATYQPSAGYVGADSFTYTAADPAPATSAPATVSIAVTAVQQPPTATAVEASTEEDHPVAFVLTASDPDDDPLTYAVESQPDHGSVVLDGDRATYTPTADFHGTDTFTWSVSDGTTAVTAPATVEVGSVNDVPVATAGSGTVTEDTVSTFTLAATDADGDPLSYAVGTEPLHGTVDLTGATATYTPAANYHGPDAFTFTASDGTSSSPPATVSISVTPVNDKPTAGDLARSTDEDGSGVTVPLAGADVDGDTLSYALGSGPAHGTVDVAGATATYVPAVGWFGTDAFTYTASDGQLTSTPATVTVTVNHVNHAPVVSALQLSTAAGTPVSTTLQVSDPDGDPVAIASATAPAHGSVTTVGTTLTYTPAIRSGSDTFLVTVSDGQGGTASAEVGVVVTARTAALQLSSSAATRGDGVSTTITATGSGATPSGRVTLSAGGTTLGSATLGADGRATVPWPATSAGTMTLVASYDGDGLFGPTTSAALLDVARSAATLEYAGKLNRGHRARITVSIGTVAGVPATGVVTLKVGSKRLTARLDHGTARFRLAHLPASRRLKVRASYAGDGQYAPATGTHTYKP